MPKDRQVNCRKKSNSKTLFLIPFTLLLPKLGVFWLNAAETWVDIKKDDQNAGLLGSMFGSSEEKESAVHAHFMSEAGVIDAFVLLGPSPADVSTQYASLTGPTPLPPMFSIGS